MRESLHMHKILFIYRWESSCSAPDESESLQIEIKESLQTHTSLHIEMRVSLDIYRWESSYSVPDESESLQIETRESLYVHGNLQIEMRECVHMHESLCIYRWEMRESLQTHANLQIEMRDSLRVHENLQIYTDEGLHIELLIRARIYRQKRWERVCIHMRIYR